MKIYIEENEGSNFQSTVQKIISMGFWSIEKQDENGFYVEFKPQGELTQNEIDKINDWKNQPEYGEFTEGKKYTQVKKLILERLVCKDIIDTPAYPQAWKDKAQARLTEVNQALINLAS